MTQLTDHELLTCFRDTHDPAALNELARRYIGLVYSSARRQVRDAHLAEDITQAVFIVLMRNAGAIRRDCILPAWLHSVTRHAVNNALRVQSRRRVHETRKVLMENQNSMPDAGTDLAEELRPHLDDAIARLPHSMRDSVILYFFGNRTHKEVGEQLGLSEDAARKRIGRALDRMRELLMGRGVGTAASSLAIASALTMESTASAAPTGLLASTINIALLSHTVTASAGAGASGSIAASIAQGVGRIMAITKIKIAAAVAGAVLITGAGAMPLVSRASSFFAAPVAQSAITTLVTTNASVNADAPKFTAEVNDKMKVTILGMTIYPPAEDTWFAANGEPIDCPRESVLQSGHQVRTNPPPETAMLLKIEKPDNTVVRLEVEDSHTVANMQVNDNGETLLLCAFRLNGNPETFSFRVGLSDQAWKTIAASEKPTEETTFDAADIGSVSFHPVEAADDGCKVAAEYAAIRTPNQMIVIDDTGKEYQAENINVQSDGQQATTTCTFKCPAEKVKQVQLQTREFNKHIEATGVSLEKGHTTKPELKVSDAKEGK